MVEIKVATRTISRPTHSRLLGRVLIYHRATVTMPSQCNMKRRGLSLFSAAVLIWVVTLTVRTFLFFSMIG